MFFTRLKDIKFDYTQQYGCTLYNMQANNLKKTIQKEKGFVRYYLINYRVTPKI